MQRLIVLLLPLAEPYTVRLWDGVTGSGQSGAEG